METAITAMLYSEYTRAKRLAIAASARQPVNGGVLSGCTVYVKQSARNAKGKN